MKAIRKTKRLTTNVTEEQFETITKNAESSGYSPNAIGRYIREQLIQPLDDVEKISISIPEVNSTAAKDLRGAVTNLNQLVKAIHQAKLSGSLSNEILDKSFRAMKQAMIIGRICKDRSQFLLGNKETVNSLAFFCQEHLPTEILERILAERQAEASQ